MLVTYEMTSNVVFSHSQQNCYLNTKPSSVLLLAESFIKESNSLGLSVWSKTRLSFTIANENVL